MSAPMVVVTNTEPRLHSIRFDKDREPIQLKPGATLVPRAEWEQAEKIAVVRNHVEEGRLKVGGAVPADGLLGMTEPKAKALVGEVLDMAQLRSWSRKETRQGVLDAIDRQLDKIEKAAAPKTTK